jgi:large subunit ribosomal protein L20
MRVKGGPATRNRRKKILKLAKGYYGAKHLLFRTAKEQVVHSLAYAFRDRRNKKRDFRKLWIVRINAAANQNGISYSKLIHGLKLANININRKMLSEIAINDPKTFEKLANTAKKAIAK